MGRLTEENVGLDDLLPYMTPEHAEAACHAAGRYEDAERFRLRIEVQEESLRADTEFEHLQNAQANHSQEIAELKARVKESLDKLDDLVRLGARISGRDEILDELATIGAAVD